jgi:hypothetical protein
VPVGDVVTALGHYVEMPALSSEYGPGGTYQQPHRRTAIIVATGVVLALILFSCANGGPWRQKISRSQKTPAPTSFRPTSGSPSSSARASPTTSDDGRPRFAVGTVVRDFTDPRRQRTLHTIIHFPAQERPDQAGSEPARGAFPLVLMAHGYRLPAAGYERILDRVTAAGYIVAAPAFPHTSPQGDGDRRDTVNPRTSRSCSTRWPTLPADRPGCCHRWPT